MAGLKAPTDGAGRDTAHLAAILAAGLAVSSCGAVPSGPAETAHDERLTPHLIGQRILSCDDGSRVDVDFITDGLKMAATWLPKGQTEILSAEQTGDEFQGRNLSAVVADGLIVFARDGKTQVCRRTPEGQ